MTLPTDDAAAAVKRARDRIAQLTDLFEDMRLLLTEWLAQEGPPDKVMAQKMRQKLSDLQTTHMMLLSAEEKFYDTVFTEAAGDTIDYDEVRADLGRRLDRIRDTGGADAISEGPDTN